jgi:hypothetical protein
MRLTPLILSTLVLATPLGIAVASAQPAPYSQGYGQGMHGYLTPELRVMLHHEQPQTGWRSMTPEQRTTERDQMRAQWDSMSEADKQKLRADLQAKWDALSPDQKQAIEQRIAERRAQRQNQGPGQQDQQ